MYFLIIFFILCSIAEARQTVYYDEDSGKQVVDVSSLIDKK